jgi:hypothetical protein
VDNTNKGGKVKGNFAGDNTSEGEKTKKQSIINNQPSSN